MPIPKCKIGFDCSLMMQYPGLSPENCENKDNCGLIYEYSQEEQEELAQNVKKFCFISKNRLVLDIIAISLENAEQELKRLERRSIFQLHSTSSNLSLGVYPMAYTKEAKQVLGLKS